MNDLDKNESSDVDFSNELEFYGEAGIASFDAKIPKFLFVLYLFLPLWGLISFFFFWNGSTGWFDRGYWKELQIAANTTFPIENQNMNLETSSTEQLPPIKQLK